MCGVMTSKIENSLQFVPIKHCATKNEKECSRLMDFDNLTIEFYLQLPLYRYITTLFSNHLIISHPPLI